MAIWRNAGLEQNAHISLWLDFAFLLAYPLGLALACWALANDGSGWFAQAGVCIGFSVLACAPLDAAENAALLSMLDNGTNDSAARIAAICAAIRGPYSRHPPGRHRLRGPACQNRTFQRVRLLMGAFSFIQG